MTYREAIIFVSGLALCQVKALARARTSSATLRAVCQWRMRPSACEAFVSLAISVGGRPFATTAECVALACFEWTPMDVLMRAFHLARWSVQHNLHRARRDYGYDVRARFNGVFEYCLAA